MHACISEISIGGPVSDSIGSGRFRFYIFPFLSGGVTIRVEVFRGGVWCYGSDTNRNPSSRDYIWRLFISGYNDSYIDPRSLSRDAGPYLFITIEGINPANDFSLNSTSGDTSIAGSLLIVFCILHSLFWLVLMQILALEQSLVTQYQVGLSSFILFPFLLME